MSAKRFITDLQALVRKFREESIELCGPKYASFSDTVVWDTAKSESLGYGKCVALVFDGGGYDELSSQGMLADMGSETYRNQVFALAKKHNMHAEDYASYLITFHAN
tara:strand:+ start:850 stop:1170 length:321 start_codon:yes stop_codon:yes gene_type:complete